MYKQEKGITLIALVVTIIVLIILAAVSILALSGDNGILTNAKYARCANAYYQADDVVKLGYDSVLSEIIIQTSKNSDYNAKDGDTMDALLVVLKKDLSDKKFSFALDKTNGVIYIKYTDANVQGGLIKEADEGVSNAQEAATGAQVPRRNKDVYSSITLTEQSASYLFDIPTPTDTLTFAS